MACNGFWRGALKTRNLQQTRIRNTLLLCSVDPIFWLGCSFKDCGAGQSGQSLNLAHFLQTESIFK